MSRWPALLMCSLAAAMLALAGGPASAIAGDGDGDDTVVPTRAVVDKRPTLVRNKFFSKRGRLELTPQFGFISNNPYNDEVMLGLAATYHITDKFGVELSGNYALLSGERNTKQLAIAVLRLLDPDNLESVDPATFITVSAVLSPMYGKLNPFGLAVVNLDFFFVAGLGYGNENIEMLSYAVTDQNVETAQFAIDQKINHLFLVHLGFGAKFFITKWMSLRLDARWYLTFDKVLNFDEETAANTNRLLGPLANRLNCDDGSDAACKTIFPSNFVLGAGLSFWLPGQKATLARQNRR